jgi:hypothetical protein
MSTRNIEIDLGNNTKLVAELSIDPNFKEIYVGVKKGEAWWQDLAVVREKYHIDFLGSEVNVNRIPGEYEVLVYGNENNEDYTELFEIPEYIYDEE